MVKVPSPARLCYQPQHIPLACSFLLSFAYAFCLPRYVLLHLSMAVSSFSSAILCPAPSCYALQTVSLTSLLNLLPLFPNIQNQFYTRQGYPSLCVRHAFFVKRPLILRYGDMSRSRSTNRSCASKFLDVHRPTAMLGRQNEH